jgi:hypothetical protein
MKIEDFRQKRTIYGRLAQRSSNAIRTRIALVRADKLVRSIPELVLLC